MARPGPVGGQYQPSTEAQIKQIHQASLTVLERTGLHVENEEALALYRQGGARVDGNRVWPRSRSRRGAGRQAGLRRHRRLADDGA
jgi:trimethylamine:corrinoid methyltransferase-like protein